MNELETAALNNTKVAVSATALVAALTKAKNIAAKAKDIGGDQAARLNILIDDVIKSITPKFRVMADAPDYLVGQGPDNEFVVTARTLSKNRATQIARLLNEEEAK